MIGAEEETPIEREAQAGPLANVLQTTTIEQGVMFLVGGLGKQPEPGADAVNVLDRRCEVVSTKRAVASSARWAARRRVKAMGSGTCSMTASAVTVSNRSVEAGKASRNRCSGKQVAASRREAASISIPT